MKTIVMAILLAAGASAQGRGARFLGAEAGMPGRVVKNAPYSAEIVTESVQTLADGSHIRQTSTVKVYRDSDGRTRREEPVNLNGLGSNRNMPQLVFINDPVAGVNYALNPRDRTVSKNTWGPRGGRMGRGIVPPDANAKTETLGRQTMEGLVADGRRVTITIPAGQMGNDQPLQIVTETWYSPDLETVVLSKRSDPRSGETVTRLVNVSRSEPPRALFEPPADYKAADPRRR
jgi:hypothetical protein